MTNLCIDKEVLRCNSSQGECSADSKEASNIVKDHDGCAKDEENCANRDTLYTEKTQAEDSANQKVLYSDNLKPGAGENASESCAIGGKAVFDTGGADPCCNTKKAFSVDIPQEPSPHSSAAGEGTSQITHQACATHLQQAFDKYLSHVERGLCICRSFLDRTERCCEKPIAYEPPGRNCGTSYGRSTSIANVSTLSLRRTERKKCPKPCCTKKIFQTTKCEPGGPDCSGDETQIRPISVAKRPSTRAMVADVESNAARKHVVLRVSGMTCTGCSRKIMNVLNAIEGVSSIRVTFVTGLADFDLDPDFGSLQQMIRRIEKETGFKFSEVISDRQTLELVIESSLAQVTTGQLREICESVDQVGKNIYRISYDPVAIGARDILSNVAGIQLAPPGIDAKLDGGRRRLIKMAWSTLVAAIFTMPVVVLAWAGNPVPYTTRSIVELVLATVVQAVAVPEFYEGALKSLVYSRVLEMDMLVVISITAAYGYSIVAFALTHAGYALQMGAFFETSSLLITLVLAGRLVAAIAKARAVSAVSIHSLQAKKAILVGSHREETTEVDARLLHLGDIFLVPPHSNIVTDGEVVDGSSSVDESMLTGENLPLAKAAGDPLIAGTTNVSGTLTVRVSRLPGKNSIADIASQVQQALALKPRVQDLADRVASYFVPVMVIISLLVFAIWVAVALRVRDKDGGETVGLAITYGIAVLAVSCPCGLGLAVPMVLAVAGGVAARKGVIIKQGDAMERGHKVTDVVFDKTGTITTKELEIVHLQTFIQEAYSKGELLSVIKALTTGIQHPVSGAVLSHLQKKVIESCEVENVKSVPGSGIQCTWNGYQVLAGNPFWLRLEQHSEIVGLLQLGMTLFCMTVNHRLAVVFGLKSTIRNEATNVVADLYSRGLACHIVSGDNPKVVEDVARAVGIPLSNVASRQSPKEKQEYVQRLMSTQKVVLFCGDGNNDAVAVAEANIGIQIGATSDVTRAGADVVLLGGLDGLLALLDISKRSYRRITFNFAWTAVYNLVAILLAGGAFVKARIPPAYAGLGEIVSVVPVIVAALTVL